MKKLSMIDDPMAVMDVDDLPKKQGGGTSVSSTAIVKASNHALKSASSYGYSHLRISNDDVDLCNNDDNADDSYLDNSSHFKDDDSRSHSQSILIH
jgi:hypothetical protein